MSLISLHAEKNNYTTINNKDQCWIKFLQMLNTRCNRLTTDSMLQIRLQNDGIQKDITEGKV